MWLNLLPWPEGQEWRSHQSTVYHHQGLGSRAKEAETGWRGELAADRQTVAVRQKNANDGDLTHLHGLELHVTRHSVGSRRFCQWQMGIRYAS